MLHGILCDLLCAKILQQIQVVEFEPKRCRSLLLQRYILMGLHVVRVTSVDFPGVRV